MKQRTRWEQVMGVMDRTGNINEWFVSETGRDTGWGGRSETEGDGERTTEGEVW